MTLATCCAAVPVLGIWHMTWFRDTGCGWPRLPRQAAKANNERDSDLQSPRNPFDLRQGTGIRVGLPCIAYRNRPANNRVQSTRMRTYTSIAFGLLLLSAACAGPAPLQSSAPSGIRPSEAPPMRISAEAEHLRGILAQDVPQRTSCAATWIAAAQAAVANARIAIERPQLVIAVDRNPRRQELCILLARTDAPWQVIGGSKVSTGQAGRRGYFITPTGVFLHTDAIIDYRAEGTFNENRIRGLGLKGMRVWDFGWQSAIKGWTTDHEWGEIRLLLHATDPDYLEPRLGRPASQGCIRISAAMN